MLTLAPGPRAGSVAAPRSKSHEHRLLIADFLAGDDSRLAPRAGDSADILATKRCLAALRDPSPTVTLDCGESGSTRRFLAPVAAALGRTVTFVAHGRLAERPQIDYRDLRSGRHELAGNVSSQFVTGLLFALPLLKGDSEIVFTSPLESRGYVDLTLGVLAGAGIEISRRADGFAVPGGQAYRAQPATSVEGDWSGAAFWYAMNALGSRVRVDGISAVSAQPDRAVATLAPDIASGARREIDVSNCPDLFPALSVVAGASPGTTRFMGVARLRIKECDRLAAMRDVLTRFGAAVELSDAAFRVSGAALRGGEFRTYGDHRIAMAVAVGATVADGAVTVDDAVCAAKSYPDFFDEFRRLAK